MTIYDACDSWAGIPEWAFSHPDMSPRVFQLFGLLILFSDKETGWTMNVRRSTLAAGIGLDDPKSVDDPLKVLTEKVKCVKVKKNKVALFVDGQRKMDRNGKPAVRWGPSQYQVILTSPKGVGVKPPRGGGETTPRGRGETTPRGRGENRTIYQEHSYQEHLINTSPHTSQAKVPGEDHEVQKIIGDRRLPKQLPCELLIFAEFMQQMSRDCFGGQLPSQVTQSNYNELKRYCKEIAQWLVEHKQPVDPAYLYAFAYYYEDLGHDRHSTPKPISYSKGWDDGDFWGSEWCMKRVEEYRDALAIDPSHPLLFNRVWK